MASLIIEVTGASRITRAAERGVLHISVASTGKSQDTVSKKVTQTCNKLRETLDTLAPKNAEGFAEADAPVTQFTMSAFHTNSYVPKNKEGKDLEREYAASTKFTAIFRDFQKLGEVTSSLFRMPHVELDKTEWRLTDATLESLGSESRKAAMHDAIRKANDFAEVLGRVPVAFEVYDNGVLTHNIASQGVGRSAETTEKKQVDGLTLVPEDVNYRASIKVKFRAD